MGFESLDLIGGSHRAIFEIYQNNANLGTPRDVIAKLHLEMNRIAKDSEFQQREVLAKGYESVMSTPKLWLDYDQAALDKH